MSRGKNKRAIIIDVAWKKRHEIWIFYAPEHRFHKNQLLFDNDPTFFLKKLTKLQKTI